MIRRSMVAVCVMTVSLAARPVFGQSAAVEGRIVDQQSLAVPGVTITLANPATGLERRWLFGK